MLCCFISPLFAQEIVDESKWDELFALDKHKTKLIFAVTEECTNCFPMFKYVDYLYQNKRNDVEVFVVVSKRSGSESKFGAMKAEIEKYGYAFRYYLIDDRGYENASFNSNPHTYIIDHTKIASEVYYEISDEHKNAILRYVKKDAQKTPGEVRTFYVNR